MKKKLYKERSWRAGINITITTLILVCLLLCNCKSIPNYTIGAANNNSQDSFIKNNHKQAVITQNKILLKRDMPRRNIHDTVKKKLN